MLGLKLNHVSKRGHRCIILGNSRICPSLWRGQATMIIVSFEIYTFILAIIACLCKAFSAWCHWFTWWGVRRYTIHWSFSMKSSPGFLWSQCNCIIRGKEHISWTVVAAFLENPWFQPNILQTRHSDFWFTKHWLHKTCWHHIITGPLHEGYDVSNRWQIDCLTVCPV